MIGIENQIKTIKNTPKREEALPHPIVIILTLMITMKGNRQNIKSKGKDHITEIFNTKKRRISQDKNLIIKGEIIRSKNGFVIKYPMKYISFLIVWTYMRKMIAFQRK